MSMALYGRELPSVAEAAPASAPSAPSAAAREPSPELSWRASIQARQQRELAASGGVVARARPPGRRIHRHSPQRWAALNVVRASLALWLGQELERTVEDPVWRRIPS